MPPSLTVLIGCTIIAGALVVQPLVRSAVLPSPRYQFGAVAPSWIWRGDTRTGAVSLCYTPAPEVPESSLKSYLRCSELHGPLAARPGAATFGRP